MPRPGLEGFTGIIDAILDASRDELRMRRHTAHRLLERLPSSTCCWRP